jgi:hypothetical protein
MSTLLLSLLLLVLVSLGLLMSPGRVERFVGSGVGPMEDVAVLKASPALANLLTTPALIANPPAVQVDTLARDKALLGPTGTQQTQQQQPTQKPTVECPKCEKCPDMSQYVRLDEVPCWNCTLP